MFNHELKGIVHVTGGGIADNLGRILKERELGAEITDLHEIPDFVNKVRQMGNIDYKQAYRLWNMGNGMLLVCRPEIAESIREFIRDSGFASKLAGKITAADHIILNVNSEVIEY